MVFIKKLIWDDFNTSHIARHNVTRQAVDEVCQGNFIARQTYNNRLLITGPDSTGNLLSIVLGPEGDDEYYPVTARPASKKERQAYRQTKKGGESHDK
jgi:uncharacterized DUF497 family protein